MRDNFLSTQDFLSEFYVILQTTLKYRHILVNLNSTEFLVLSFTFDPGNFPNS